MSASLPIPDAVLDLIAERAAELVLARLDNTGTPWRDLDGAAAYLARSPDAVRKLVDRGKLRAHQDGRRARLHFHTDDLDHYMRRSARP